MIPDCTRKTWGQADHAHLFIERPIRRSSGVKQTSSLCHSIFGARYFGRRGYGLLVFCGCNIRLVLTAETKAMAAYRRPEYPAIMAAADAFHNDTNAVGRRLFLYCAVCTVCEGRNSAMRAIIVCSSPGPDVGLCAEHTRSKISQSTITWFVCASRFYQVLLSWNSESSQIEFTGPSELSVELDAYPWHHVVGVCPNKIRRINPCFSSRE